MKRNSSTTIFETAQWFIFILASSVAIPIVIGSMFGFNISEIAGLMQRTIFVVGLTSFLQGWLGHRLPIVEGPAGLWISIFAVMAAAGAQQGADSMLTLRTLESTMLFTGLFLVLFGLLKIANRLMRLFTPLVTGSFLFLLTVQLSGTFLKGMLGIQQQVEAIHLTEAVLAFVTFFLVLGLSTFGRGWLSSYAVLLGIVIGWVSYVLFVGSTERAAAPLFAPPQWLDWGAPILDVRMIPIAFLTAVILLSNVVASILAINQSTKGKPTYTNDQINRGSAFLGVTHGLSGMFSAVANVPLASTSGFINLTGQKRKAPFMYASILYMSVAFFPQIVGWISTIPGPIANGALLATFVQLMGLGLSNIMSEELDNRRLTIIGISYLIGIGTMFLPAEAFVSFPPFARNLASNGLLIGTILVILLEQFWKQDKYSKEKA
ncbi:purine/pyrimidine permease [Aquibacillus sp. 3ASR75-11]|uniref:Purine/pyrimidine permease n=1 Tax=Terrihalobacillus insolitus TaxID=2950438 RepID=A0A9X3WRB1_9BACI|nr:purine/pyrimidine permease [Terrihalobacillus insolitus]MDC3424442.1 purine/pyrimidine permease [Terrihalobacillus insolitus]